MFIHCILLSIGSTLDALGIGISYGLKNTKILFSANVILFVFAFLATLIGLFIGNCIDYIFPSWITNFGGAAILIGIGIWLIFSCFQKKKNFDFDGSNVIDNKEALALGFAISMDAFGVGISSSMLDIDMFLLPLFSGLFHVLFLLIGNFLGRKINKISKVPSSIWNVLAGVILIVIGFTRI